jgi:phospholipid/cholesterol/gamma-HCH transport system substrate-binding protein
MLSMDDQVNDTLVGAFVLVLGGLLIAGVLWLSAGLGSRNPVDAYQAVIQESVAGLNVDAPVKYLGVDVGKVSGIEIDPQNSQQVRLHFLVNRGTPIKRDSLAVLKTQGLTGIAYVELSGGSTASPALLAGADGVAPTIPFKLSLSARLESVVTKVLTNVDHMTDKVNAVFDADNQAALKATLADAALLAHALAGQRGVIQSGLADAARTARLAARAGVQLAPTLARVASSAQAIETMAGQAGEASVRAGRAADAAASGVQQIGSETLPDLERLMSELGLLSSSLRRLSEQTTTTPSSLLLGNPPPRPGPGESAAP